MEEGERDGGPPGESDPCIMPPQSLVTSIASSPKTPILQIDRENVCIFLSLLLLLIGIIGALSFALGQWSVHLNMPRNPSTSITIQLENASTAQLTQSWRKREEELARLKERETPIERLLVDIIPVTYDLYIDLSEFPEKNEFQGKVDILLDIMRKTDKIQIHASTDLRIRRVEIVKAGNESESPIRWLSMERLPKSSILCISVAEELEVGERYHFRADYSGTVCKSPLYCQRRTSNSSATFFASKFEPEGARKFLPCFDEPGFKAIFRLKLLRGSQDTVLSNTDVYKEEWVGINILTTFMDTPPMSTYLLALVFGVGPSLVSLDQKVQRGITVRVWAMEQDIFKAQFALEQASYLFEIIENYFTVKYPMNKLDLVSARSYPVGAMENYGLLVFHHKTLLTSDSEDAVEGSGEGEEDISNIGQRFKITKIIIHEILHQWFGNLVTMEWWDDLWLNEGFSTFFNYKFAANSYPLMAELEYYSLLDETMFLQSGMSKFPLIRHFNTTQAINRGFDMHHLYIKGAAMVRMLSDLLGSHILRGGLIHYLQSKAYGTARTEELWGFLGSVNQIGHGRTSVDRVMESWVRNPGFPQVEVFRSGNSLTFRQAVADVDRHLSFRPSSHYEGFELLNFTWTIPVVYSWQEGVHSPTASFWLQDTVETVENKEKKTQARQWLLVNPGFQFPYRVNYDRENWNLLIHQLYRDHEQIPEKSRLQLISDSDFFLKWSQNFLENFRLLGYLKKETALLPLMAGLKVLFNLLEDFKSIEAFPLLLVYYRPVIENMISMRNEASGEAAAAWKLSPGGKAENRLQALSCALYRDSCISNRAQVIHFLNSHNTLDDDLIPICHFLYQNASSAEIFLISQGLKGVNNGKHHLVHLAMCTRDLGLYQTAADYLIASGNAGYIVSSMKRAPLVYNQHFRVVLWEKIAQQDPSSLHRLFAREHLARMCLNSAGSTQELEKISEVIPGQQKLKEKLRLKLQWMEGSASPLIEQWLLREIPL